MYKPLFEFIKTNKFYLFLDIELSNLIANNNKTIRKIDKMQIFNHEGYNRYKKYKTNFSGDPRYNYIYQSKVVIKLFNIDDIDFCLTHDLFNENEWNRYFANKKEFNKKNILDIYINERGYVLDMLFFTDKFKKYYSGFINEHNTMYLFTEHLENFILIDGNYKFDNKERLDFDLPNWVIEELMTYTKDPKKRLGKNTKMWLLDNFKKPYTERKLYRSFGINLSDINWDDTTLIEFEKKLKQYTGINKITDLKVKGKIFVNRSKESSWSTNSIISNFFNTGMASNNLNFLVKTVIPAHKIIMDFNLLPEKYKNNFKFIYQNECIVDTGKIECILDQITIDNSDSFKSWLKKNNLIFIQQKGFIKIS